ncbi:hypothetical protein JCM16307_19020 [Thermococcus prieurii]
MPIPEMPKYKIIPSLPKRTNLNGIIKDDVYLVILIPFNRLSTRIINTLK